MLKKVPSGKAERPLVSISEGDFLLNNNQHDSSNLLGDLKNALASRRSTTTASLGGLVAEEGEGGCWDDDDDLDDWGAGGGGHARPSMTSYNPEVFNSFDSFDFAAPVDTKAASISTRDSTKGKKLVDSSRSMRGKSSNAPLQRQSSLSSVSGPSQCYGPTTPTAYPTSSFSAGPVQPQSFGSAYGQAPPVPYLMPQQRAMFGAPPMPSPTYAMPSPTYAMPSSNYAMPSPNANPLMPSPAPSLAFSSSSSAPMSPQRQSFSLAKPATKSARKSIAKVVEAEDEEEEMGFDLCDFDSLDNNSNNNQGRALPKSSLSPQMQQQQQPQPSLMASIQMRGQSQKFGEKSKKKSGKKIVEEEKEEKKCKKEDKRSSRNVCERVRHSVNQLTYR
jgi:hypothetical protein